MKVVEYNDKWPESFKISYYYDLMEVYDKIPPEMRGYAYQYQNRKKSVMKFVRNYIGEGSTVLDVAAAQGNFSLELAEQGYEVTWNDLREELVDYVKQKHEKGIINYEPGNIFDFNFHNQFDAVIITEIIEHVAHPDEFLQKISKMVKPGGYIIMSTPNGAYFLNKLPKFTAHANPAIFESQQFKPNADGHIFLIHPSELQVLCEKASVRFYKMELYSNFITNGHLKSSFLLKILPRKIIWFIERVSNNLPFFVSNKVHSGMTVLFKKL